MSRNLDDLLPTPLQAEHLSALAPLSASHDLLALLDRWVERRGGVHRNDDRGGSLRDHR